MMTNGTRAAALGLVALLLPLGSGGAQSGVRVAGDSVRIVRLGSPERDRLLARIDSLTRMLYGGRLDSLQYLRVARTVNGLVLMLHDSELRAMQSEMRRALEMGAMDGERTEAMARDLAHRAQLMERTTDAAAVSRGWIGLMVEAPHIQRVSGGRMYVRYLEYPEVVSVEPNSPAEQAGVERGDVVLAFDGRDVKQHEINVSQVLTPARRLAVTLRGEGDRTRVVSMKVARSPDHVTVRREGSFELPPEGMPFPALAPEPPMPPRGAMRVRTPRTPTVAPAPEVWRDATPPVPPVAPGFAFVFESGNAPVAGANLTTLNAELGRAFGASQGLLVLAAAHGSPARDAGLRGGDVIVKVGGRPVRSLSQFRSLVATQSAKGRGLDLDVKRAGKIVKLRLDWGER